MSCIVSVHGHLTWINELVVTYDSHIAGHSSDLLFTMIELSWGTCSSHTCKALVWANWVITEACLVTGCGSTLVGRLAWFWLRSTGVGLLILKVDHLSWIWVTPILKLLLFIIVVCSIRLLVYEIYFLSWNIPSDSMSWLRLLLMLLFMEFSLFATEVYLTSWIIGIIRLHQHCSCCVTLARSRLLIFTWTSLWISALLFFNNELLATVGVDLLNH